jgi:flavin reductase (DIM6/NTAB) family NADH-FMN oxidoreductase RutF
MTSSNPSLYEAFARYGSGITLVAVRDGAEHRFFIAGSVLTASVDPFTLAISVGADRDALPAITAGAPWTVSVLSASQLPLVRVLTSPTPRAERLQALVDAGALCAGDGPLCLPEALVTLWCVTHSATPLNDQVLLVGEVQSGSVHRSGEPLLRWNRQFHTVGAITADTVQAVA